MIDWRHWHNEPWLIGGLVVLGWLWAVLAGPLRSRLAPGKPFPRGQAVRFYLSLLVDRETSRVSVVAHGAKAWIRDSPAK